MSHTSDLADPDQDSPLSIDKNSFNLEVFQFLRRENRRIR